MGESVIFLKKQYSVSDLIKKLLLWARLLSPPDKTHECI